MTKFQVQQPNEQPDMSGVTRWVTITAPLDGEAVVAAIAELLAHAPARRLRVVVEDDWP